MPSTCGTSGLFVESSGDETIFNGEGWSGAAVLSLGFRLGVSAGGSELSLSLFSVGSNCYHRALGE